MPPRRKRKKPLFVALAVTAAHGNSAAPYNAEEVIAAKVICPRGRMQSETFFAYTTNKEGSTALICQDFIRWIIHHTDSPVCVVVGLDKFSNTSIGRMLCLSGCHITLLDLSSMLGGMADKIENVLSIVVKVNHVVAGDNGHIPPREEANFIERKVKKYFPNMIPPSLRRRASKVSK